MRQDAGACSIAPATELNAEAIAREAFNPLAMQMQRRARSEGGAMYVHWQMSCEPRKCMHKVTDVRPNQVKGWKYTPAGSCAHTARKTQ